MPIFRSGRLKVGGYRSYPVTTPKMGFFNLSFAFFAYLTRLLYPHWGFYLER